MPILNHKIYGQGPTIVILHGLFGCLDNWHRIAKALSEQYQVITCDLRNHGRSFHSPHNSYQDMADDIETLRIELKLESFILLGHSMGAKAAMHYAQTYPSALTSLVLVDMAPKAYSAGHQEIFNALNTLKLSDFESRQSIDQALSQSIPDFAIRAFLMKNLTRDANNQFEWKMNLTVIEKTYPDLLKAIPLDPKVTCPTLWIKGSQSPYIKDSDWPLITQIFPQSQLIDVKESGHWVHAEAPEAFLSAVTQFLAMI